jgi:hypothetical protein
MQRVVVLGLVVLGGCERSLGDLLTLDIGKTRPIKYATFHGFEYFDYALTTTEGYRSCHLVWAVTGSSHRIPKNCVGCKFVFDVELQYDAGPYQGDSYASDTVCTALKEDISLYRYAYSARYESLLVSDSVYSYLHWLDATWAEEEGTGNVTLTYSGGVKDERMADHGDAYAGYYYTYYWYGKLYPKP